jgi:hypothetical protein
MYRRGPPVAKALARRFIYGEFKPSHAGTFSAINGSQIIEKDRMIMQRHIPLGGLSNFRDLGGYEIKLG